MPSRNSAGSRLPPNALPTSARFPGIAAVTPPRFVVDLSAPAEDRYSHMAPAFADQVATLPALYDELLEGFLPRWLAGVVARITPLLLRRAYDGEETRELRGISRVSGVQMHLLVAFNVLLDLLMGCTSGGARVRDPAAPGGSKILHFRSLDWGMEPLRRLVVEIEYIRRKGGPVVARSVTYFGYIGVLTGVREGLSMSLNFRPHHDSSTRKKAAGYAYHLLQVLFGARRSISSVLRRYLIGKGEEMGLEEIITDLETQRSTAAYLIFSDGAQVVSMEKDNGSASMTSSSDFLVTLNHDVADERNPVVLEHTAEAEPNTMAVTGMEDLVAFSIERKQCAVQMYDDARLDRRDCGYPQMPLEEEEVIGWMEGPEIVNEESHYGVIMDPLRGEIVWLQRWFVPLDPKATRKPRARAQGRWENIAWTRLKKLRQDSTGGERNSMNDTLDRIITGS